MNQQMPPGPPNAGQDSAKHPALHDVSKAHELLTQLRQELREHPELDEAISRLERALSVLALESGALL